MTSGAWKPPGWNEDRTDVPRVPDYPPVPVLPVDQPPARERGYSIFSVLFEPPKPRSGTPTPKMPADPSQPDATLPPPGPPVKEQPPKAPPKGTEDIADTFNRDSTVFDLLKRPTTLVIAAAAVLGVGGVIALAVASSKKQERMKGGM